MTTISIVLPIVSLALLVYPLSLDRLYLVDRLLLFECDMAMPIFSDPDPDTSSLLVKHFAVGKYCKT
jgi:hypothetical protein